MTDDHAYSSTPRLGVALSGGGHRAAVWSAGAALALIDMKMNDSIVSVSSVSGGSVTNGVLAAAGDVRQMNRTSAEACLKVGLEQWAHAGLFFPGPTTNRWLAGTLGRLTTALGSLVALAVAVVGAGRDWSMGSVAWTAAGAAVLVLGVALFMALKVLPGRTIRLAVCAAALLAWPLTFFALLASSRSSWWLFLIVPIVVLVWWEGIHRFGGRSAIVEDALARTLFGHVDRPLLLKDLAPLPVHHLFCATDLRTGNNLYMSNRLVWGFPGVAARPGTITVGKAVQASACLPGAFLARDYEHLQSDPPLTRTVVLSDGGVYDNMADQWEWGFVNRKKSFDKSPDKATILRDAQSERATHLVVVNASRGMTDVNAITTLPGLKGELASAMGAKNVLYDVSTATRRRLLIDTFDAAAHSGGASATGLGGMLVHIGTSPYLVIDRFGDGHDDIAKRAAKVMHVLDSATELDWPETKGDEKRKRAVWAGLAGLNASVKTTLAPLELLRAGSSAELLQHAWVLTAVSGYILHGWGESTLDDVTLWQRKRFTDLVRDSKGA